MTQTPEASRQTLLVEQRGRGLLRLTLSRPDRGNALNAQILRELSDEMTRAETDPDVRMIVLRGAGKHFCGGADIGGAAKEAPQVGAAVPKLAEVLLQLDHFPKPTIAFVHGACIGAALALVSCCDALVAAPDAFFSIPEVRLGMTPSLLPFFVRAIGYRAFRLYGLSGERFNPEIALRYGLVSEIAAFETWNDVEARLQDAFLHAAPLALGAIKSAARRFAGAELASDLFGDGARRKGPEAMEGKASFKEKRKPNWWIGR